jgi:hypothetical protein
MQSRLSIPDNDVNMKDATASDNNHISNSSRRLPGAGETSQKGQNHDLCGAGPSAPGSSTLTKVIEAAPPKRSGRQNKGHLEPVSRTTRSGSSAIATAAADAAKAGAVATARQQAPHGITSHLDAQQDAPVANRVTVTTSGNPSPSPKNNPPMKSAGAINLTPFASHS